MPAYGSIQGSHYGNLPPKLLLHHSDQFISSSSIPDQSWFVDFGAMNHIISNLNNLSVHTPYYGGGKVTIGNGKQLPITHVGIGSLQTFPYSNSVLCIPNILYVPSMRKNLLSVSQFTREHNVIAEFHFNVCFIKDKTTRQVLLQGHLKDGLYRLDLASKSVFDRKFAHLVVCVSVPLVSYLSSCTRENKCTSKQCNR